MGVWNVPSSFKSALQVSVDGVGWSVSQLVSRSVLLKNMVLEILIKIFLYILIYKVFATKCIVRKLLNY